MAKKVNGLGSLRPCLAPDAGGGRDGFEAGGAIPAAALRRRLISPAIRAMPRRATRSTATRRWAQPKRPAITAMACYRSSEHANAPWAPLPVHRAKTGSAEPQRAGIGSCCRRHVRREQQARFRGERHVRRQQEIEIRVEIESVAATAVVVARIVGRSDMEVLLPGGMPTEAE